MNTHFIKYSLGKLLQLLAFCMVIPAIIGFVQADHSSFRSILFNHGFLGFALAIVASFIVGTALTLLPKSESDERTIREGFAIVTFAWLLLSIFGGIPFWVYFGLESGHFDAPHLIRYITDAFFEVMSGFTTTGSSIISDVEKLPDSIHFWRSMTHWLGGMGIVTLGLAIFPAFGVAAYQLFRGETPGPTAERLAPSMSQTAKILWGVYALLTLIQTILLLFGGMSLLEAVCHAFGSMSTGGFSTRNASVGGFNSAYIEWVTIVFMFLGGANFMLHYQVIFRGRWGVAANNHEFRFYGLIILIAIVMSVLILQLRGLADPSDILRSFRSLPFTPDIAEQKIAFESGKIAGIHDAIRHSAFQVISITTTTGYCTADFDMWPDTIRLILLTLMIFGGCAGSTSGGMKIIRIMIIFKAGLRELRSMIQPRQIIPVRIANKAIDEKQVRTILGFMATFAICTALLMLIMTFIISDFTTAITSVIASICNTGPGLGGVGPMETYAWIPIPGKWVLAFAMLLGRLELFTVFIALSPTTWRK